MRFHVSRFDRRLSSQLGPSARPFVESRGVRKSDQPSAPSNKRQADGYQPKVIRLVTHTEFFCQATLSLQAVSLRDYLGRSPQSHREHKGCTEANFHSQGFFDESHF